MDKMRYPILEPPLGIMMPNSFEDYLLSLEELPFQKVVLGSIRKRFPLKQGKDESFFDYEISRTDKFRFDTSLLPVSTEKKEANRIWSGISHEDRYLFLELDKRVVAKKESIDMKVYRNLCRKIEDERATYVKRMEIEALQHRFNDLIFVHPKIEKFILVYFKNKELKAKKLFNSYMANFRDPKLFFSVDLKLTSNPEPKACPIKFISNLGSFGNCMKFDDQQNRNFDLDRSFYNNLLPSKFSKHLSLPPVSEDEELKAIIENFYDPKPLIVVSFGTLVRLLSKKVNVSEHFFPLQCKLERGRKLFFIDKPLLKRSYSTRELNDIYFQHAVRSKYQDINSDSLKMGPNFRGFGNKSYLLFELGDVHLLVRTKFDSYMTMPNNQAKFMQILSKGHLCISEERGLEFSTDFDILKQWAHLFFHENVSVCVVHVDVLKSRVHQLEKIDQPPQLPFISDAVGEIFYLFKSFSMLNHQHYLLHQFDKVWKVLKPTSEKTQIQIQYPPKVVKNPIFIPYFENNDEPIQHLFPVHPEMKYKMWKCNHCGHPLNDQNQKKCSVCTKKVFSNPKKRKRKRK